MDLLESLVKHKVDDLPAIFPSKQLDDYINKEYRIPANVLWAGGHSLKSEYNKLIKKYCGLSIVCDGVGYSVKNGAGMKVVLTSAIDRVLFCEDFDLDKRHIKCKYYFDMGSELWIRTGSINTVKVKRLFGNELYKLDL